MKEKTFKERTKERSKASTSELNQGLPGFAVLHQFLHCFLEDNMLCAGSEVSTVDVLRLLVQGLPYRCSGNFWMFCHQKRSSHLKRSPHPSVVMGCTSLQVNQEGKQSISNAVPHSTCLLVFFCRLPESTYLHEKRKRGAKSQYFALYHLQFLTDTSSSSKSYSLYIKGGKTTLCSVAAI